jgi:hypothetical protein
LTPAPQRNGTKLARVSTPAGGKRPGARLLHHRDDLAAPLLRSVLHRVRKPVHLAARQNQPTGAWVTRQARNLSFTGLFERPRFLIDDRDSKFSASFDDVFRSEGIELIHTQAPGTSGERLMRRDSYCAVRAECLDWLLILGRRLEDVLRRYVTPQRRAAAPSTRHLSPAGSNKRNQPAANTIERHDLLGRLIHEYRAAA